MPWPYLRCSAARSVFRSRPAETELSKLLRQKRHLRCRKTVKLSKVWAQQLATRPMLAEVVLCTVLQRNRRSCLTTHLQRLSSTTSSWLNCGMAPRDTCCVRCLNSACRRTHSHIKNAQQLVGLNLGDRLQETHSRRRLPTRCLSSALDLLGALACSQHVCAQTAIGAPRAKLQGQQLLKHPLGSLLCSLHSGVLIQLLSRLTSYITQLNSAMPEGVTLGLVTRIVCEAGFKS